MALTITRDKTLFEIVGRIDTSTVKSFETHLKLMLTNLEDLTLNIDKVSKIDASGMKAIRNLYDNAMSSNKKLCITGLGCKEIYEELRSK
ncbi:STAS domain-containing protein [Mesoflavibacter zeaxanthinifaciens]|uniref:STAS domain-containing protein n=1 Tax=Mesoflavibacter zeaxanthinifaciens TaxID=393060 RepID=UPI003A92DF0C